MTREEIINEIKLLLEELNYPDAVSYLTQNDVKWLNENIKALEQQPCDDAISRQEVLDQTYLWSKDEFLRVTNPFDYLRKRINSLSPVNPQEPQTEWIPIEWKPFGKNGYPKPEDEYKHFLTIDDKGEITIQEFLLSLDEEPQPYFTGMRRIIAWMPLPEPYEP